MLDSQVVGRLLSRVAQCSTATHAEESHNCQASIPLASLSVASTSKAVLAQAAGSKREARG